MATVFNPFSSETDDESQNSQQKQAQSGGNNSLSTSGVSAFSQGGSSNVGAAPAASAKAPTSSGSFTNIQSYLNANKEAAPGLANQVSGNIKSSASQAQEGIQKARNAFDAASSTGTLTADNAAKARDTVTNAGQALYGEGTKFDPNAVKDFQRVSSGAYKGPNSLEGYGDLSNQAQNVRDMGNLSNTENGRFTLLRQMFNGPSYTSGQTNLDQFLVGSNQKQLEGARQQAYKLPAFANQNIQGAASTANRLTDQSARIGADTRGFLDSETGSQANANTKALQDANAAERKRQEDFAATTNNLQGTSITAADAQRFGIDPIQSIYNLDLNKYLKNNIVEAPTTVDQIIDRKNAARTNALGLLAGGGEQFGDLTKVGGYVPSTQTFDTDKFKADQADVAGRYDSLKNAEDKWNMARLLLHPGETTNGGQYQNIANEQYADMTKKYGSLENAKNYATGGFQGDDWSYNAESQQIQNLIDQLNGMQSGRMLNVLPDKAK